ncbi:Mitochondrial carrier protein [Musa troglodytarum]|uniref:ADP/ATP translocase n=1 Tax=Musa troglodytarum TaxID=320322 RepID=A0A9E7GXM1_9LILI|nr:Mitochondrial carrier protein [Musa troglodytarum]
MMRKAAKKGGERQFNGLVDVCRKTLQSDGIAGVCIQRIRYIMRIVAFYFGMHDALKPLLLTGKLQVCISSLLLDRHEFSLSV